MKILLIFLCVLGLSACNDSATVTQPNDADHTQNRDTSIKTKSRADSVTDPRIDSTSR